LLEASHLSPATQILTGEITLSLQARDYDRSRQLVARLLGMRDLLAGNKEKAEATLECALVSYQMGSYREAIELLEEARRLYRNNRHYMAVVLWMIGSIQWMLAEEHDKAYLAWSQCIAEFETLQNSSGEADHARWYAERVNQIKTEISQALKEERLPDFSDRPGRQTGPDMQDFPEPIIAGGMPPADRQTMLQLFRVVDEIPSQGFGPGGFRPFTIGEVDIDRVTIQGKPFRMVNVHNEDRVISLRSGSYVVLKVTDDRMDACSPSKDEAINAGDFVLVHLQDTAGDGAIVAVRLGTAQSQVSLARLRVIQNGQYLLEPQSKNPAHQPNTFNHPNEGFRIYGIVLVVFKPIIKRS
jgi:hypothetical protein